MLRSLRTDAGLTAEQVAQRLGVHPSTISRLETGQRGANKADIVRLCDLYQVDERHRSQLAELAAEGKKRSWWQRLGLPYAHYVGLETAAESISDYGLAVVPGLLQTPDYARALHRARTIFDHRQRNVIKMPRRAGSQSSAERHAATSGPTTYPVTKSQPDECVPCSTSLSSETSIGTCQKPCCITGSEWTRAAACPNEEPAQRPFY
jgi:transcriptional regulator with XRE-family HTH domain